MIPITTDSRITVFTTCLRNPPIARNIPSSRRRSAIEIEDRIHQPDHCDDHRHDHLHIHHQEKLIDDLADPRFVLVVRVDESPLRTGQSRLHALLERLAIDARFQIDQDVVDVGIVPDFW